jgi:hypothetical protein
MKQQEMAARMQAVEDTLQIDKLEKIYGYYLDNGRYRDVIDLFSDNTESVEVGGQAPGSDAPPTAYHPCPNLEFVPFHWKHPVTGKETVKPKRAEEKHGKNK